MQGQPDPADSWTAGRDGGPVPHVSRVLGERCHKSTHKVNEIESLTTENKSMHGDPLPGTVPNSQTTVCCPVALGTPMPSRSTDLLHQPSWGTGSQISGFVYLIVGLFWKHSPRLLYES